MNNSVIAKVENAAPWAAGPPPSTATQVVSPGVAIPKANVPRNMDRPATRNGRVSMIR